MVLPNFLICGAPKAGTTALYEMLSRHPDVLMSSDKETEFFEKNYRYGVDWYARQFLHYQGETAIGEASPGYMIFPDAPARIAACIPDARLVFILRNPIERAFSQYWFGIQRGVDDPSLSFSSVIRDPSSSWGQRILELGLYHEQLSRFERFFDRSQMKIILHDDFRQDTQKCVKDLLQFIQVDSAVDLTSGQINVNATIYPRNIKLYRSVARVWRPIRDRLPTSVTQHTLKLRGVIRDLFFERKQTDEVRISDVDRAYLADYYREPNRLLSGYLDVDLAHWQ